MIEKIKTIRTNDGVYSVYKTNQSDLKKVFDESLPYMSDLRFTYEPTIVLTRMGKSFGDSDSHTLFLSKRFNIEDVKRFVNNDICFAIFSEIRKENISKFLNNPISKLILKWRDHAKSIEQSPKKSWDELISDFDLLIMSESILSTYSKNP